MRVGESGEGVRGWKDWHHGEYADEKDIELGFDERFESEGKNGGYVFRWCEGETEQWGRQT